MKSQPEVDDDTFCSDESSGSSDEGVPSRQAPPPLLSRPGSKRFERSAGGSRTLWEDDDGSDEFDDGSSLLRGIKRKPALQRSLSLRRLHCPQTPEEMIETKSTAFLRGIQDAIEDQKSQEKELQGMITVHTDRAEARFTSSNTRGAVLSMRRLQSLKQKHQNIKDGIAYLVQMELDVKAFSEEARKACTGAQQETSTTKPTFDLSQFNYREELDSILSRSTSREPSSLGDEELLVELAESTRKLVEI